MIIDPRTDPQHAGNNDQSQRQYTPVMRDIIDRKRAELALAERNAQLALAGRAALAPADRLVEAGLALASDPRQMPSQH
jgi:hypothetical protein